MMTMAAGAFRFRVKTCVPFGDTPLFPVMVMAYELLEPGAGIPLSVAVLFPLSTKVTPEGSAPVSDSAAIGNPLAVTVKDPDWPIVNVALLALVIAGAWSTVRVFDFSGNGNELRGFISYRF